MNRKISEIQAIGRQHRVPPEPDLEPTVYDMCIKEGVDENLRPAMDQMILEEIHDQAIADQDPSGD